MLTQSVIKHFTLTVGLSGNIHDKLQITKLNQSAIEHNTILAPNYNVSLSDIMHFICFTINNIKK